MITVECMTIIISVFHSFNNDIACLMNFHFHLQLAIAPLIIGTLIQYSVSFRNYVNVNGNI